jgi:diguanylate cyclase (GGDEF)-like protein/PAS domain S-box-containing protein
MPSAQPNNDGYRIPGGIIVDLIHSLLTRQIRKFLSDSLISAPEMKPFIEAVNAAYYDADADLRMLERALDLSSNELLQANVELRTIFQTFPDLLLRLDSDGKILDYVGGISSDSRMPQRDQVIGTRVADIPIEDVAKALDEALTNARNSGTVAVAEYSISDSDEDFFYEARFSPLRDGNTIAIIRNITKRKRAEVALQSSERRLSEIIDFLPDSTFAIDLEGKIIAWNRATEILTGLKTEDMIGKGDYEYSIAFHGARVPMLVDYIVDPSCNKTNLYITYDKQDEILAGEYFNPTLGPEGAYLRAKASPLYNSDGEIAGAIEIIRNISEIRRAEKLLLDTSTRLKNQQAILIELSRKKTLFNSDLATAISTLTTAAGKTLDVDRASIWLLEKNQMKLKCSGFYRRNEEEPAPLTEIAPSDLANQLSQLVNQRISTTNDATKSAIALHLKELGIIPKNTTSGLAAPIMIGGSIAGVVCYLHTGRMHEWTPDEESFAGSTADLAALAIEAAERRKMESHLRMKTEAMNAASDQIIIMDKNGKIEFVNPSFEREHGYTLEELKDNTPDMLFDESVLPLFKNVMEIMQSSSNWHGEMTLRRKDGTFVVEDVSINSVRNPKGEIEHFIGFHRNITEKKLYEEQLNHLAHHDSLTGLPNRLLFNDRLSRSLAQASRDGNSIAVLFLDLDRFKQINDSLGHSAGDLLLQSVSERLRNCIREADTIARMGGDEFTIILSGIDNVHDIEGIARRTVDALSAPFVLAGRETFVTVSIGIGIYPVDGNDADTILRNADTAMYRAKEQGRNGFSFYTTALNAVAEERSKLEASLRRAVEQEEFFLNYQPRVNLFTGELVGAEALIRWHHPELGTVSPARFITLAEETGLIVPISNWVLQTACRQNKAWQDNGLKPIRISVNISSKHIKQDGAILAIRELLEQSGLPPEYIEMEITEGALIDGTDMALVVMEQLKEMGLRLSLDDFGTGYSSLTYLKRFPIDSVKIDQSFVRNLTTNPDDAAIARAVVAMTHSLNLTVVAEGVETLQQLQFLKELGCDEAQGYFVGRPIAAEAFEKIIRGPYRLIDGAVRTAS